MTASPASTEVAGLGSLAARGQVLRRIRDLHPGSFAFVMATGILSSGELSFGAVWLSVLLLVAAIAGYVVLCLLFLVRLLRFPGELWADSARPERAFGFFTFVAGSNVIAVRLFSSGYVSAAEALTVVAAAAWALFLTASWPASCWPSTSQNRRRRSTAPG